MGIKLRRPHYDPEFATFTYGDDRKGKRTYLLDLDENDLLVFYVGLRPFHNDKQEEGLYIIGCFTVKEVVDFNRLSQKEIEKNRRLYPNNAHIKGDLGTNNLVMVVGDKARSKLLDKAILLSEPRPDCTHRNYPAVSAQMEELLGIEGFIHKSIPPRIITDEKYIENLKRILGRTEQ